MSDSFTSPSIFKKAILNKVQQEAVLYNKGPQLVFAGAGTGKTRVLTAKIAFLIEDLGIPPHQIFAATFTNKAAREMKERVQGLTTYPCDSLWIGTFHSLCARMLRREARHIGYTPYFTIYDTDDQKALVRKVLKHLEIDERTMTLSAVMHNISKNKNACKTPSEALETADSYYLQQFSRVYKTYQEFLHDQNAMDFDDLITNTVYLWRNNPDILKAYQNAFQYVLIDEYQDTNRSQFHIVSLLAQRHQNIFAVGDDDQSIYGWRGAQVENILTFEKIFLGTKVFKLEQNYRSTESILDFANAAIKHNEKRSQKELWTSKGKGDAVRLTRYGDDRREADATAEKISSLIRQKISPSDILVLFRTNAQSRAFEEAFRRRNIPYILLGGTSFYQRKEIKDCLAYLRLVINPADAVSFERVMNVPTRGIGAKAHEKLLAVSAQNNISQLEAVLSGKADEIGARARKGVAELKEIFSTLKDMGEQGFSPEDILEEALRISGYVTMLELEDTDDSRNRLDNISELVNAVAEWVSDNPDRRLADFLEEISLVTDADKNYSKAGRVPLMTLHGAKGLEAPYVFIGGLEDGILPSKQNFDDPAKIEEERRLLYVGITRAMKKLECSYVDQRWRFGSVMQMEQSRFLDVIPANLYEFMDSSMNFHPPAQPKFTTPVPKRSHPPYPPNRPTGARGSASVPRRKPTVAPPRPRPSTQYDDFNQDTVQFRMGQHIKHKTYGIGRILNISGFGVDMRITVLFNDGTRKKMMAKFANLEVL